MKEEYAEKDLEDALVSNVTQFLLELGKGFAYVGRQMELRMDDETAFFPDLVFYHIPQKRYVIIELKAVKFEPEFAGKLNFYVTAATIYTKSVTKQFSLDLAKHLPRKGNRTPMNKLNAVRNAQYQPIDVKQYDHVHDRYLCIDWYAPRA